MNSKILYKINDALLVIFIILRQMYYKIPDEISFSILGLFLLVSIFSILKNGLYIKIVNNVKYFFLLLLIFIICILCLVNTGDPYLIIICIYSLTLCGTNKDYRIKNILNVTIFMFVFIIFLSLINFIPMNREPIFTGKVYIFSEKLSLGFVTANYAFLIFDSILLMFTYLKKRLTKFHIIIFLTLTISLFLFTRSRTGFLVSIMFLSTYNTLHNFKFNFVKKVNLIALFGSITVTFLLGFNVFKIGEKFDGMINGRPSMWNYYLSQGLTFKGHEYAPYIFVDNYYLFLYCIAGIMVFSFIIFLLFEAFCKSNNKRLLVIFVFIFIYFTLENCIKIFVPLVSVLFSEYFEVKFNKKEVVRQYENSLFI